MFQANQSFAQLTYIIPALENQGAYYGMILAILVGVVIIGGIRSIANVTDKSCRSWPCSMYYPHCYHRYEYSPGG
jgi:Na+/alanine symporter